MAGLSTTLAAIAAAGAIASDSDTVVRNLRILRTSTVATGAACAGIYSRADPTRLSEVVAGRVAVAPRAAAARYAFSSVGSKVMR